MKSLLLVVCAFLVMSSAAFAGDWFDLVPSVSDTVQLYSDSKDTTVYINFNKKEQSFIATLYMSYVFEYYDGKGVWLPCTEYGPANMCRKVKLPPMYVNQPYKPAGITFSPRSDVDTNGLYRVRIKAENGPQSTSAIVYFRVTPPSGVSRFYTLKIPGWVDKLMITYDTSIHNRVTNSAGQPAEYLLGKGASLRRLLYQGDGTGPYCFSVDKQNNFWLASWNVLTKYEKTYNTTFSPDNSDYRCDAMTTYYSHKFGHLADGTTFVGNNQGLFKIKDGVLVQFPVNDTNRAKQYTNDVVEYKDTVWVQSVPLTSNGTFNPLAHCVSKYFGDTEVKLPICLKDSNYRLSQGVGGLKVDRKGFLWGRAGIFDIYNQYKGYIKLLKFDGTNWITFPALDSTDVNYKGAPEMFEFDHHGKMWILTNKKNLIEFDGISIGRVFDSETYPELKDIKVRFMLIDSANTLYMKKFDKVVLFNPDGIPLPSIAATAVEEEPIADAVTGIYPQPAREYVTFELPSESEFNPTTIEVLNSAGMNAMSPVTIGAQASGRYTLPTSELPSGLYFAVLHSGKMLMKKPVVVVR